MSNIARSFVLTRMHACQCARVCVCARARLIISWSTSEYNIKTYTVTKGQNFIFPPFFFAFFFFFFFKAKCGHTIFPVILEYTLWLRLWVQNKTKISHTHTGTRDTTTKTGTFTEQCKKRSGRVGSQILTSCQPHRVTWGRITLSKLLYSSSKHRSLKWVCLIRCYNGKNQPMNGQERLKSEGSIRGYIRFGSVVLLNVLGCRLTY